MTKNLATFKRWDGIRDEKLKYYGGSLKNPIFRSKGSRKTNILGGRDCLKRSELEQFADLRSSLAKRREGIFKSA